MTVVLIFIAKLSYLLEDRFHVACYSEDIILELLDRVVEVLLLLSGFYANSLYSLIGL